MNCTLTIDQQKKLFKKVYSDLLEHPKEKDFDFKEYANSFYNNIIEKTGDVGLALSYIQLLPQNITANLGNDLQLTRTLHKVFSEVAQHIDDFENLDTVAKFIAPDENEITTLKEANEDAQKEALDPTVQTPVVTPIVEDVIETNVPQTALMSDWHFESDKDALIFRPEEQFYSEVKRKIIDSILSSPDKPTSYPDVGRVFITALSDAKIDSKYLRPGTEPFVGKGGVVLAITNSSGDFIYFDEKFEVSNSEKGKPAYYNMYKSDPDYVERQIKMVSTVQKISEEEAKAIVERDIETIGKVREYINANPQDHKVRFDIIGGHLGTVIKKSNIVSSLSALNLGTTPFNITWGGKNNGFPFFEVKGINTPIQIEKPIFSEPSLNNLPQRLASLLFDDLKHADGGDITAQERIDIASQYIYTGKERISLFRSPNNKYVVVKTPMGASFSADLDKEGAKTSLIDYLTKVAPTREITAAQVGNRKVLDGSNPEVSAEYKENYVVKQNDKFFIIEPMKLQVDKFNLNNNRIMEFETRDGKLKTTTRPYLDFVKEHFKLFNPLDAQGRIQTIGAYLVFKPRKGELDKVYSTKSPKQIVADAKINALVGTKEEKLAALNAQHLLDMKMLKEDGRLNKLVGGVNNPLTEGAGKTYKTAFEEEYQKKRQAIEKAARDIENLSKIGEGKKLSTAEQTKLFLENKLKNRPDRPLNKVMRQKAANTKVTAEQIKAAKEWYDTHPLSKYVPYQTMFDMVNLENSKSIAHWTTNGITLFKGSDYSDLYHESWHGFSQVILSQTEKKSLYKELRKKTGSFKDYAGNTVSFIKATDLQLEEHLAEDFRKYALSGGKHVFDNAPVKSTLFRRIWNFLKSLFYDTNLVELNADLKANKKVKELYDKLWVGDINELSFSESNRNYNILNKGMERTNTQEDLPSLGYEDTNTIMESVDSLFSEYADFYNSGLSDAQKEEKAILALKSDRDKDEEKRLKALQGAQTYKYTSSLFKTEEGLRDLYDFVQWRFSMMQKQFMEAEQASTNPFEKTELKRRIDTINYALRNFGDVENLGKNKKGKGVIGYHLYKSELISKSNLKDIIADEMEDAVEVGGKQLYDRGGNENSLAELADEEIEHVLRGLNDTNGGGEVQYNVLGFPKLAPYKVTLHRIMMAVQNVTSPQKMYEILQNEQDNYPPIKQLLTKLGPVSYPDQTSVEVDNWNAFFQTFNKYKIPLRQTTVNIVTEDEEGNPITNSRVELTIGEAFGDYKNVGNDWQTQFSQATPGDNNYIINVGGRNRLDLEKITAKYPDVSSIVGKELTFLKDIGITLRDDKQMRKALAALIENKQINLSNFPKRLQVLREEGNPVVFINQIVTDEGKNFKELQILQTKLSGEYADGMSRNAEGDLQSVYSLNTSLTQMVKRINEASNFADLVSTTAMSHLSPYVKGILRNPFIINSVWMNSIFDMKNGGVKRPGALLRVENLSGVTLLNNGKSTDTGTATATADPATKLIMDFHLQLMKGTPEMVRMADKKTSLTSFVSKIVGENKQAHLYVDTAKFIDADDGGVYGNRLAFNIIFPYLKSELMRVAECKRLLEKNSGLKQYDFEYLKRGSKIVLFDGILSDKTKEKLVKVEDYSPTLVDDKYVFARKDIGATLDERIDAFFDTGAGNDLRTEVSQEVSKYFVERGSDFKSKLAESDFVAKELIQDIRTAGQKESLPDAMLTDSQLREAAVKSFVYNNWIHNAEQSFVLLGDVALYKDFNKRIPGFNSTGDVMRTDSDWYQHINKVVGNPYRDIKGLPKVAYNGLINTAIVEDVIVSSHYMEEYKKVLGDNAKKYEEINEGDAGAWMTFDMYRVVRKSLNKWTPEQESLFQKIIKGDLVENANGFFPVVKMSYAGPLVSEYLPLSAYHKFALFPLIPNVIKGTTLELLHNKMMREDVGYVTFESGSKVSTITNEGKKDKLYSNVGARTFDETPFTKNTVYGEYLKDQIEVSNKFKHKITFASQMRTLVDTGLLENGVPVDFKKGKEDRITSWNALSETDKLKSSPGYKMQKTLVNSIFKLGEVKKQQLIREMGWSVDKKGIPIGDVKTLVEFVNRELETKDLGEHERVFLQIGKDGQLKHDLSLSPSSDQIEKLIIALLNKRLIKYKVNGEQLTQVSGAGFEKPSKEDIKKYSTNDLPTYHRGKGGLTQAAKCKIALQGDFKKLLNLPIVEKNSREGGITRLEALNDLIKDEKWLKDNRQLITMVGARIPTQGLNSMEFVEVWEFLPENAGNILIMPAEITAKSGTDYDYDKLPFMMPNLRAHAGELMLAKNYTEAEVRQIYDIIKKNKIQINELRTTTGELRWRKDPAVDKLVSDIFSKTWQKDYTEDEVDEILKEEGLDSFDKFYGQFNGSGVVENEIIQNFRNILEQPENFENLIKPNDTNLVEPLAKELSKYVADATYKKGSGAHLFDFLYNLNVHQVNSVGKKTLGIAAVANIYNSILNDVGAVMNPYYTVGAGKTQYRNQLLLEHNKLGDVISLSNLYSKDGTYIPEIISQLMNGLVDVAKDPWIFYLQANEELAPSLLFMIKAGVPLKQAVYMLTQPLVREYVKKQQLYKSTFAPALGLEVVKYKEAEFALRDVLNEYGFGTTTKPTELYDRTLNLTKEFGKDAFKEENLLDIIKAKRNTPTDQDRVVFLHYIEIEKMAKSLAELQGGTNADRRTSQDFSEMKLQGDAYSKSQNDNKLPADISGNIMKNTSVGAFNVHGFMLDILGNLIKLKNHPILNEFISADEDFTSLLKKETTKEAKAKLITSFRNDLLSYVFQNEVRGFNIDSLEYKGSKVDTKLPVEEVEGLAFGAFVKDNTLFVDKKQLKSDFDNKIYATPEYTKRGLAMVSHNAFLVEKDYTHFVYEREVLRTLLPFAEIQDNIDYKKRLAANTKTNEFRKEKDTDETFLKKMKRRSYEEFLRDKALENTNNPWAMFRSENAFAIKFTNLKRQYPELSTNYSVVRNLIFDLVIGYKNLKLSTSKLDKDSIELYNENLKDLADKSVMKVSDVTENDRISDLFARFPFFAFMQSGMNTKSFLSLGRIIPQEMFIRIMEKPQKEWMEKMSPEILTDYLNRFIIENSNRGIRIRSKDYLSNATLDKPVVKEKSMQIKLLNEEGLVKRNLFTVNTVQSADKKAKIKASIATKYIGFGEGIAGSSTEHYRKEAGEYANTGSYDSSDVVFVSVGGNRGAEDIRKREQDKTIKEALKAIESGATLLTDNKSYLDGNKYNSGEQRLAKNLESKGYNYSEQTIDGQLIGVWTKSSMLEITEDFVEPIKPEIKKISDEEVCEFLRTCYL